MIKDQLREIYELIDPLLKRLEALRSQMSEPEPEKWWLKKNKYNDDFLIDGSVEVPIWQTCLFAVSGPFLKHLRPDLKLPNPGESIEIPAAKSTPDWMTRLKILQEQINGHEGTIELLRVNNKKLEKQNENHKDYIHRLEKQDEEANKIRCKGYDNLSDQNIKMRECLERIKLGMPIYDKRNESEDWTLKQIKNCLNSLDEVTK